VDKVLASKDGFFNAVLVEEERRSSAVSDLLEVAGFFVIRVAVSELEELVLELHFFIEVVLLEAGLGILLEVLGLDVAELDGFLGGGQVLGLTGSHSDVLDLVIA